MIPTYLLLRGNCILEFRVLNTRHWESELVNPTTCIGTYNKFLKEYLAQQAV